MRDIQMLYFAESLFIKLVFKVFYWAAMKTFHWK